MRRSVNGTGVPQIDTSPLKVQVERPDIAQQYAKQACFPLGIPVYAVSTVKGPGIICNRLRVHCLAVVPFDHTDGDAALSYAQDMQCYILRLLLEYNALFGKVDSFGAAREPEATNGAPVQNFADSLSPNIEAVQGQVASERTQYAP